MRTKSYYYGRHSLWLGTALAVAAVVAFPPTSLFADDEGGTQEPFVYEIENRPDPFKPFISDKSASDLLDMNEIVEESEPLTGMQIFEPGQLRLVALLKEGERSIAMVEDTTGRGYTITEGIKIGRHGVIKQISNSKVVIEEKTHTRAGKEIINQIVMTLNKDEGEK